LQEMRIGLHLAFPLSSHRGGYRTLVADLLRYWIFSFPEHTWVLVHDGNMDIRLYETPYTEMVYHKPISSHPLLMQWWYNRTLPALQTKLKVDTWISFNGLVSPKGRSRQISVCGDLSFMNDAKRTAVGRSVEKRFAKASEKADQFLVFANSTAQKINARYGIDKNKIHVIHPVATDDLKPMIDHEKQIVRIQHTEGREYFLYLGLIGVNSNLINLLKAFSVFKKRLQSNMQLVIAGKTDLHGEEILEQLSTYKFREEVKVLRGLSVYDSHALISAAYALIDVSVHSDFSYSMLQAQRAGVSCIIAANDSLEELSAGASFPADPGSIESIADCLMEVYKNENLKEEKIKKGLEYAGTHEFRAFANEFILSCTSS
jgi:glycosyltransferase involved in cell wall biosynthesis